MSEALPRERSRLLTVDDLFRLEFFDDAVFSPDGKHIAYSVRRAPADEPGPKRLHQFRVRNDMFVQETLTGKERRITDGRADGLSWSTPLWSPDSRRIAMQCFRIGCNRLWVWDSLTGEKKLVTEHPILVHGGMFGEVVWISKNELVCVAGEIGTDEGSRTRAELKPHAKAMDLWRRSYSGEEVTADVFDTVALMPVRPVAMRLLLQCNVETGEQTILARGNIRSPQLSPNGEFLCWTALPMQMPSAPLDAPITYDAIWSYFGQARLEIFDLKRGRLCPSIDAPRPLNPGTVKWSGAKAELVIFARAEAGRSAALFHMDVHGGALKEVQSEGGEITACLWTPGGELMVQARAADPAATQRNWYVVSKGGERRKVGNGLAKMASQILFSKDGGSLLTLVDGKLWRVPLDQNAPAQVALSGVTLNSIVWPKTAAAVEWFLADSNEGLVAVDLRGYEPSAVRIEKPLPGAALRDVTSSGNHILFGPSLSNAGIHLWVTGTTDRATRVVRHLNRWVSEVKEGPVKHFRYNDAGREMSAWLVLPPEPEPQEPPPCIVWLYPGDVYGDGAPDSVYLPWPFISRQVFAARGYAFLTVSVPISPPGEPCETYTAVARGVQPAIDRAIELGFIDPSRLALMGHSLGGYAVNCLISETDRFKAAVTLSGMSNLSSAYGTFDARSRYGDMDDALPVHWGWYANFEAGHQRMGAPPWRDFERYNRNSPLAHVEKIRTPVLLVHGDNDFTALQQSEEFYLALNRAGKRARYIRYAGEGHNIEGKANLTHLYDHIDAWLRECFSALRS